MEGDDGSSGLAAAAIVPQAISSQHSSLGDFFLASDLVELVTDVDDNNNNNNDNIINDDNNDDNLNNQRPISKLTLGDVLNIDKKKPPHSRPFFRAKLKLGTRFFCNPRPVLSKLSLNNKKPTPPQNSPFYHNPQPRILGAVLNSDKKPSNFCSPWSISKITINNVFNCDKKPPPPKNPSQPVSKLALGVVSDSDKQPPPPPPPAKKRFLRSLLASIRVDGLKVRSGLNKKSWKSSNVCRRLNQDEPFHYISDSNQNKDQNQTKNQDQDQNHDQDMNMVRNSLTNSTGSDDSPRLSDTLVTEYTLATESNHDDVVFKEVDGEWSIENSGRFDPPVDVVVRKEKTQRKFSRELFVMWCLFVGCLSFFLSSFFRLS